MTDTSTSAETEASTEVDLLVQTAIAKINAGSVTYEDLLDLVAKPAPLPAPPAQAPLPVKITDEQQDAIKRLPEVFGQVMPTTVRKLEPDEVTKLLDERAVLKVVGDLVGKRVDEGIRTTVLNHRDEEIREQYKNNPEGLAALDMKDGHYVLKGEVRGDADTTQRFSISRTEGTVSLNPNMLKALADDETIDWFTHKDYLEMTEQTRVFSAEKTMLLLKKRPELIRAVHHATTRAQPYNTVKVAKA